MEGYAKIPLEELSILEAAGQVDDASWWDNTLPPILQNFPQITIDDYWGLSVKHHRLLYEWLVMSGVVKDGDNPQT